MARAPKRTRNVNPSGNGNGGNGDGLFDEILDELVGQVDDLTDGQNATDEVLDNHAEYLDDHESRLGKVEEGLAAIPPTFSPAAANRALERLRRMRNK